MTDRTRLPVTEVLATLVDGLVALPAHDRAVAEAGGLVLADDVRAPGPLPPEDRAAMDGVAVLAADVAGATAARPCRLVVDGASLAGRADQRPLAPGTAREVATGALLPPGADAIVRVEDLRRRGQGIEVCAPVPVGRDVRPAAQDAAQGQVLVAAGRRLDAGAVGGLAGAGIERVHVVPAPRVAVVPTGDEVVAGTTPDAVGPLLVHLLGHDGATVTVAPPVRDDPGAIVEAVGQHAARHDVVVTVGGVSVGPRDHAGDLVAGLPVGAQVSLAMRPGRPFAWGRTAAGVPVLCLPGTPLAALAAAVLLLRPVVARLAGRPEPCPSRLPLSSPVTGDADRRSLLAATVSDGRVRAVAGNGAADLARLAATAALVDLPAGTARVEPGVDVAVWVLP